MANMRQHREPPDLLNKIADLERRLAIVETARRLGNASVDVGRLVLRNGDLVVVDDNGNETLLLSHGETPAITMSPSSIAGGFKSTQFAWESDANGVTHELRIEDSDGNLDGGKVLLNEDTAYLSRQPHVGNEVHLALGEVFNYQEHIRFKGRWIYNDGIDSTDGIVFGYSDVSAGFGAVSFNFPWTFDLIPIVLVSVFNSGTAVAWDLSAISTSGFTVAWATGTTAKTIMWAAFRR